MIGRTKNLPMKTKNLVSFHWYNTSSKALGISFPTSIDSWKQTSKLRVMNKTPYTTNPQTRKKKECQIENLYFFEKEKKTFTKYDSLIVPPHDNNPLPLILNGWFYIFPCGTPLEKHVHVRYIKACWPCGTHVEKLCMCIIWCAYNILHGLDINP